MNPPAARTIILTDAGPIPFSAALAAYDGTAPTPTPTPTPTVTLSTDIYKAEGNSGSTLYVFIVTRSASIGAVSIPWSFSAGTTGASDYVGAVLPTGGTVVLPDGQASGAITIAVQGDLTVEPDEVATVSITPPSGYQAGARTSATLTITNDDATPATASADSEAVSVDSATITVDQGA